MKKMFGNIVLTVVSLGCSVVLLEVACHFVVLSNDTDPTYKLEHNILPYTMKPSTKSTSVMGHAITINSHGLRDHEYSYKKPAKTFRIVVLGDSSTFAYGNQMKDGFTKVLEEQLNELTNSEFTKFEVINTGHPGYNTTDELNYLRLFALRYNPDAVVVATMTNDFLSDSLDIVIKDGVDSRPGSLWLAIPTWVKRALRQSRLYVAVGYLRVNMASHSNVAKSTAIVSEKLSKNLKRSKIALEGIIASLRERNIPVTFISLPNRFETQNKTYISPEFYEQVGNYAKAEDVNFINMLDHFTNFSNKTDEIFAVKDSSHPNPKGHALLTKHLFKGLVAFHHLSSL